MRELTGGTGADVGFECTSVQPALDTLFDAIKPTGVIVVESIWATLHRLEMQKLVLKEIDLRCTIAYVNSHPETIKLVQDGKVDLKPFITGTIALDDLIDEGFDTLIHRNETAVKILSSSPVASSRSQSSRFGDVNGGGMLRCPPPLHAVQARLIQ